MIKANVFLEIQILTPNYVCIRWWFIFPMEMILTSFFFITKSICMYFINIVIVIPSYEVLLLLWGFNSYTSRINHKYASLKIVPNDLVSPLSLWHEKNGNEWCGTCWNSSKIFTHLFQKGHCSCWDTKQAKYLKCPTAVFLFFFPGNTSIHVLNL